MSSWNLTTWSPSGYGPYYAIRVYMGKEDNVSTQDQLQAIVRKYFPKAKAKYRLARSTGLPEYYIYLGKQPPPPELQKELDIF